MLRVYLLVFSMEELSFFSLGLVKVKLFVRETVDPK